MTLINFPAIYSESGLVKYLQQIAKFPMLSEEEEHALAVKWYEFQDLKAAHSLVTSHLRLVSKLAIKFNGYGLPIVDIISEGNLGLMHAIKKFNPYNGSRFSTYAMWWIKAYIQDYILKSWSLVKIGTSAAKKKLFYNLNKVKNKLLNSTVEPTKNHVDIIADELEVNSQDVIEMENMMACKTSLNDHVSNDEDGTELIEFIADNSPNQETILLENNDLSYKRSLLTNALQTLSKREQDIISARMLQETPMTLESLSKVYQISCERVRQIEAKAFEKLKIAMVPST